MNRREFSFGISLAAFTPTIFLSGCSQNDLASYVSIIGTTAVAITSAIGNSALASEFQTAVNVAINAIDAYKSGNTVQTVEDAINAVLSLTDQLGLTTQYEPIITALVAGLEGILNSLPQTASILKPNLMIMSHKRANLVKPIDYKQFKKLYNDLIPIYPELKLKKIGLF